MERRITHVVYSVEDFKEPPAHLILKPCKWYGIPIVTDECHESNEMYIKEAARKINEWITNGHTVIVSCNSQLGQTVHALIQYFITYKGWSYDLAFNHLKFKMP